MLPAFHLDPMRRTSFRYGLSEHFFHMKTAAAAESRMSDTTASLRRRVNHRAVIGAPMAPGIPLGSALPNVIAAVRIGMDGNTAAFQGSAGCECVGGECGATEGKRDRNNNDASAQHELGT